MAQPRPQERSRRTGRLVCRCRRGYASEYDGLCFNCRGMTAAERRRRDRDPRVDGFQDVK